MPFRSSTEAKRSERYTSSRMSDPALHDEDAVGKVYDGRLARRLFAYARPYRALVAGALALLLTDGVLQLAGPLLTRIVIDNALPARDFSLVAWATAIVDNPSPQPTSAIRAGGSDRRRASTSDTAGSHSLSRACVRTRSTQCRSRRACSTSPR